MAWIGMGVYVLMSEVLSSTCNLFNICFVHVQTKLIFLFK